MAASLTKPRVRVAAVLEAVNRDLTAHSGADLNDRTMASWNPPAGSADSDLIGELDVLVPRSRDLARNNGIAAGAMQTYRDNIIGNILRLSSKPDYRLLNQDPAWAREWGNNTEAHFASWANSTECDAGRTLDLLGLAQQALGGAMLNGEALAIPLWLPRANSKWSSRLMLIEADRLATPPGMETRKNMRGGIEIDKYGAPLAYWIQKDHPGDTYGGYGRFSPSPDNWQRIPAFTAWGRRRVIHLHDKERTGQSRGKPIIASVMREFKMAGHYATTELQAAVANSLIAAFLESNLDQESTATLFGADPSGAWNAAMGEYRASLKGGAIIPLPVGAKLSSHTPGRPNAAFEGFMEAVFRHIGVGLNLPYELLMKDFSKTNYSSARASMLEAWRYFNGRRSWMVRFFLQPIYELWMEEAVSLGQIDAPDYYQNLYAYQRSRWIFAGRGWVDPVKEADAAGIRMDKGLSTLEAECAEQGLDYEEVMEQRAHEQMLKNRLGLVDVAPSAYNAPAAKVYPSDEPTSPADAPAQPNKDAA